MRKKISVGQKTSLPSNRPPSKAGQTQGAVAISESRSTYGPIPDAEQFALYVQAQPDAGDRILKMAESSLEYRQKAEYAIIKSNNRLNHIGLVVNFLISLSPIVAAVVLALNNRELAAAVVGGGGVVAFTGTTIYTLVRTMKSGKD